MNGRLNELALTVLKNREFAELESNGLGMELRLPAHFDEARQVATAVDAANDLRMFGFGVELDPRLGTPASTFVETRSPDPGHDLALLTYRLAVADQDHEAVARHADTVFGSDGTLARLATFTGALAGWAARLGHTPGDDLSDILAEHAHALDDIHRQLADTAVRIKVLGTLHEDDRAPSPRRHAATATTQARPAAPTPAQPPRIRRTREAGPAPGTLIADITFGTTVVAIGGSPNRHSDAACQLEQADFAYLPDLGIHELPAGTHPEDALLRIEYAADLLAAAGHTNLGIDPDLTRWLERQARQTAARAQSTRCTPPPHPMTAVPKNPGEPTSPQSRTR
ncbi:hypothetical protein ACIQOW_20945 [Kitasatospora sp. NPDC091335]|uniref:hypothetical protein n=1 Tax=Kitasatospora sp. NPDC091335 TaxID=3364085 RepID=UPI0037F97C97